MPIKAGNNHGINVLPDEMFEKIAYPPQPVNTEPSSPRDTMPSSVLTATLRTRLTKSNSMTRRAGPTGSLRHRRQPSLVIPTFRSISATDHTTIHGSLSASPTASYGDSRSQVSSPPSNPAIGTPSRRLARSAHLHSIGADRPKHQLRRHEGTTRIPTIEGEGEETPRTTSPQVYFNEAPRIPSRIENGRPIPADSIDEGVLQTGDLSDGENSDWRTDPNCTEASAS